MIIQNTGVTADGASLSAAIVCGRKVDATAGTYEDIGSFYPVRVSCDSARDTAAMTFQAAGPDGTFYDVKDEFGTEVSISSVAASTAVNLDPAWFRGACQIKVRSGTSGTPVAQSGATTVTVSFDDFNS